jgi:hypothetical protein
VKSGDALAAALPSELVYDIGGRGYTRFRAIVGFDERCLQNDIGPSVRFFVFKTAPDPERLVRVAPAMPVTPPLTTPFTSGHVISTVFEYMLGRPASAQERKLAGEMLATDRVRGLADLLWAIAMQAEFQLIY